MNTRHTERQLVAIVGETASGKTSAAIALAKACGGEIISADSWAVYRGFDIGTAKPTATELDGTPIHLIDVADPREGYSAAEFKRQATAIIKDIQARGKLPIIAGGTGLYVDSVLYDFSFMPAGDATQREQFNNMNIQQLLDRVEAQAIDTTGIDTRNKRRLIRLLETSGQRPEHTPLLPGTIYVGIRVPRDQLYQRIIQRVDVMLDQGLEGEVRRLSEQFGWDVEPMKGIGYREWRLFFEGEQDLEQTRDRIISATNNLAKRQRTWFKRNQDITWFDQPSELVESVAQKMR